MSPTNYRDDIIAEDTGEDESSLDTGAAQPLTQAEIEDLLYGQGRSTSERLQLLRSLRDDIAARDAGSFGEDDPAALVEEINERISELESEDNEEGDVVFDADPLAHRETLAPDSDELDELKEDDEEALEDEDEDEGDIDNDDDVIR